MEFRILGPLDIRASDGPIALGGLKRRGLLALLLVQRGRAISTDRIVTELWGEGADAALATIQTYVSQLRKLFAGADGVTLTTRPAGYVLDLPEDALDADRFEQCARAAANERDPAQQLVQCERAFAIWSGTPLEEFSWPWAVAERGRLERLWMDTVGLRIDARLTLGDHLTALGELEELTREHPLDERLWAQQMLAAYRAGRQGDALRAFQEVRQHLLEQLGVEPGPELAELERRILDHDASLAAPRAPSLPTGVVTFLLTDIVGSSELWENHPRAMEEALARHDAIVRAAVSEAGGHLLKARGEGDSTFSVFSRATDAVTAAVDVQRRLRAERWPPPVTIHVRAAIHTGESVERDGDYFGPIVNRAARIRGVAGGDEVLLSDAAAEVVRFHLPPDVQLVQLARRVLKGSRQAEQLHRLVSDHDHAGTTDDGPVLPARHRELPTFLASGADSFVGRREELAQMDGFFDDMLEGTRPVVFVTGEAGIGKTSLVSRFAQRAEAEHALVIAGRCDEGYDVPYQPFVEALGQVLQHPAASCATQLDAQLGGELARILPDASRLLPGLPLPIDADSETSRYRLFEAVAAWLTAIASETPIVLVLDDIHWASAPTLFMMRHVARYPTTRVMIIATYRQTEVSLASTCADVIADLRREPHVHFLELAGLEEDDVATLIQRRLPESDNGSRPTAAEIRARTRGNALFVRELLRSLAEPGRPSGTRLSPRVRDVVIARVQRLPELTQRMLEIAAILGPRFRLRSLLGAAEPSWDQDALLDAVDDAIAARVLREVDDEPDVCEFEHAIIRDAIESSLSKSRRLRLHLAAGRALEEAAGDTNLAQISYHFSEALPLASTDEVVVHSRRAGDRAMSLSAFEEAVDHYTRALDAVERAAAQPTVERCELLLALAGAHAGAGSVSEAARSSERAAEVARALDLPEHFALAALVFEGELVSGAEFWEWRLAMLEEANTRLRTDSELRARVIAMLAHVRAGLKPGPAVAELSTLAVEMATRLGSDLGLAAALQARRQALSMPSHTEERAALSRRVIAHGDAAGASSWSMLGRHSLLADLLELGDLDTFRDELRVYSGRAEELRRPHDLWRAAVMHAGQALFAGSIDDGATMAAYAYELGTELEQPGALQSYVVQQFHVWWRRGELEEILPSANEWADARDSTAAWRAALAVAYAEAGRLQETRRELERLVANDFVGVANDNLWLATMALAAEAAWAARDGAFAPSIRAQLIPNADRNIIVGTALALGSAERPIGLMHALSGELDAAIAALERAIARNARMGSPMWVDVARQDLVTVLRQRAADGDLERADFEQRAMADER